jgi:Tol biopolymer transport system component
MRKLYWIVGGTLILLSVVGAVGYVALNRQRQAFTPGTVVGLGGEAGLQSTSDTPAQRITAPALVTPAALRPTAPTATQAARTPGQGAAASTVVPSPLILQPAAPIVYDDFTRLNSGWAPFYIDSTTNFNGYSTGAYVFDAASPNMLLYDISSQTYLGLGRYAIDLRHLRGDGAFGLMLDVQGDPNHFESLSYYSVGLTSEGTVVLRHRDTGAGSASVLAEAPIASGRLNRAEMTRMEIDATPDGLRVLIQGAEALRAPGIQLQGGSTGLFADSSGQPLRVAFDNLLVLEQLPTEPQVCADIRRLFVPPQDTERLQGDDIRVLQQRLARLGYDAGPTDAVFGPLTAAAVVQFQQRNGLVPDGVVGPQTWCRIFSSDAILARDGNTDDLAEQRLDRPIDLSLGPDGSAPLFVSVRQADESWRLALALPGRSDLLYLTTEGDAYDPAWSPDKSWLAFASGRDGIVAIWLLDIRSGELRRVTPPDLDCQFPAWAPDSRTLIYTAEPRDGQPQEARDYLLDLVTGQTRLLSQDQAGWADWSANNEIVVTRWTGKSFDLFRANPDGSGMENISNTDDIDEDIPAWSPDGTQIAFVGSPRSDPKNQRHIFVMQRDGFGVRQLTTISGPNSNPIWSSDGRMIAFANQSADGSWQPWLMTAAGDNLRQLSANADRIWFMSWPRAE